MAADRYPTITLSNVAPVGGVQGDMWIKQSTTELFIHNGLSFQPPILPANPNIDGPILQTIGGQTLTIQHAVTAARTATFPDNTGTVAELNLAQTWTAVQTIQNPVITGATTLAIRDTSAAFDVTLAGNSASAALTAGRTLTFDVGNVAHTVQWGTTANTLTFPNAPSGTVPLLNLAQTWTAQQNFAGVTTGSQGLGLNSPLSATALLSVPNTGSTNVATIDANVNGAGISILNNATQAMFGSQPFGGLLVVSENTAFGNSAVFIVATSSNYSAVVAQDGGNKFSATAGNANTVNIYSTGAVVTVQNKTGSTISVSIISFRTRIS